jgi:hypothetical protein
MPKTREYTKDGMKMIFNSGNKTYDTYVVSITPGQSIGGGVTAYCIRAFNDQRDPWNKLTRSLGYNQKYDLDQFKLPQSWRNTVARLTQNKTATLHEFYHYGKQKVVHGWLLMRDGVLLARFDGNEWGEKYRRKSMMVLDEAIKYLSDSYDDAGELIVKQAS